MHNCPNLTLNFYGLGARPSQSFQAVSNFGAPTSYINVNDTYQAVVNEEIFVVLTTNVYATSNFPAYPYSAASAYIDPYFWLSPSLIDAGYSIEWSPGVGNAPIGTPGPTPGAGLAGLVALTLTSLYARARRV